MVVRRASHTEIPLRVALAPSNSELFPIPFEITYIDHRGVKRAAQPVARSVQRHRHDQIQSRIPHAGTVTLVRQSDALL